MADNYFESHERGFCGSTITQQSLSKTHIKM